jgi:hypothetical protein
MWFLRAFFDLRSSIFDLRHPPSLQSSVFSLPLRPCVPTSLRPFLLACLCLSLSCTAISIAPSCPNELRVGESAPLLANELTPGEIATYSWIVDPPSVGQVGDPSAPSTTFRATAEGNARIELTANDGLYQVTSFCTTRVSGIANTNDNGNENDNAADNENENTNANTNTNTNDNRPEIPDRPGGVRKERP